ncbi:cilia- and flagella-associated protein 251-like [Anneissia japonica]|uniref:cilia- and flagella-associated protein 251-like n=1 Tax=Anneissia japonica TaxID=1529436 RepID=UPI001425AA89|nr:cilia- and flagella-associated protein 251-like [Anneissia japonica]
MLMLRREANTMENIETVKTEAEEQENVIEENKEVKQGVGTPENNVNQSNDNDEKDQEEGTHRPHSVSKEATGEEPLAHDDTDHVLSGAEMQEHQGEVEPSGNDVPSQEKSEDGDNSVPKESSAENEAKKSEERTVSTAEKETPRDENNTVKPTSNEMMETADTVPDEIEQISRDPTGIHPPVTTPAETGVQHSNEATENDIVGTTTEPIQERVKTPDDGGDEVKCQEEERKDSSCNALNLSWTFGVNKNVPALNLATPNRKAVLYAGANTCILFDYVNNTQKLLQGHSNNISCTCSSNDKRWVATADKGPESMLIIWDSHTGVPVQTLFTAHSEVGVVAMAMTPDAKYLVTISAGPHQVVDIWDWTTDGEVPVSSAELVPAYGTQTYITFNPEDTTQLVSNSDCQVIFYAWENGELKYVAPSLTDEDFNRVVGSYSQSIFRSGTTGALTATYVGNVVVWDNNRPISGPPSLKPTPNKKAFKLVRLQDRGITVLTTTDMYVVTGDVNGHVKFYDQQLRVSNWYNKFDVGPINSISFEHVPNFRPEETYGNDYPPDATIDARMFITKNYVISTTMAQVAAIVADGSKVQMIQTEHDSLVHAIVTHPTQPLIAIGSYSCLLKVWNYQTKTLVISRQFPRGHMIRCLAFDPKGEYLGVGFTNGCVRILDVLTLEDDIPKPFTYSSDAVIICTFSHDSAWMATADANFCVTVYKGLPANQNEPWTYLGKHRSHYKPIRGLTFGIALDSDIPRLLSIGEDRSLVEYDLFKSTIDDLRLMSLDRIEQTAIPQCIEWYPPITKEQFLVTANDQFKFKLYNSTTKMCRKTLLSPTYGSPLQKMVVLPTKDVMSSKRYISFITKDKIGLNIMPLDGNPHNGMALIAHPGGVVNLVSSNDGQYVFTAGGADATVHMWNVNIQALEAVARLGGEGLTPFYGLLEGGRDGVLFRELENYFYYAQLRSQGIDTLDSRVVSTEIILSEVPFVMRAMGLYPSEQEVEDMLNEVKFSEYVETGKYVDRIDLGTFIKLYVNHRPAFGLSVDQLHKAFEVLGLEEVDGQAAIERGDLLDILQTRGEHMTEMEVAEYITTLLGFNPEGGSSELGMFNSSNSADLIEDNLPEQITADMFAAEILGFGQEVEAEPVL